MCNGITQSDLKKYVEYVDGNLIWYNHPTKPYFNGRILGYTRPDGYRFAKIMYVNESIHRLVWLYFNGSIPEYPEYEIDHIDRDKSNNRIGNLRVVNKSTNQFNTGVKVTNGLGHKNIYKRGSRFRVGMTISGSLKWFGSFKTMDDAISARNKIYEEYGRKE